MVDVVAADGDEKVERSRYKANMGSPRGGMLETGQGVIIWGLWTHCQ